MHIILTGATGLVGSAALHALLRNSSITRISIFSRSTVSQAIDSETATLKCTVYTYKDFATPPDSDTLSQLQDAKGCIWALGVSTNSVDAKTYEKVTVQYPLAWARAFAAAGLGEESSGGRFFNFVYVSGEGATLNPGFTTPRFGRVKGEAEKALLDLSKEEGNQDLKVYSARAGAVDRAGHTEIARYNEAREGLQKKLEKPVKALLRPVWKSLMSPTKELGDSLVKLAAGDGTSLPEEEGVSGEGRTLGNVTLRKLAGL